MRLLQEIVLGILGLFRYIYNKVSTTGKYVTLSDDLRFLITISYFMICSLETEV